MIETGGRPLVVNDEQIVRAREAVVALEGVNVSATGAAGLAGWAMATEGCTQVGRSVVLLTGVQR